jgi:hypothetical protein
VRAFPAGEASAVKDKERAEHYTATPATRRYYASQRCRNSAVTTREHCHWPAREQMFATDGNGVSSGPADSEHLIALRRNQNATNPAQLPATGGNLPPDEIKE